MQKLTILFITILASSIAIEEKQIQQQWKDFQAQFGKTYRSPVEARKRFAIFKANIEDIEVHNIDFENGKFTYRKGVNQFTDWTKDEFKQYLNRGLAYESNNFGKIFEKSEEFVAPEHVDWREQGVVTEVKSQGSCGACWAFGTTGALEGQMAIANKSLISLSEQNLIDCSTPQNNHGCRGGNMVKAFTYIQANGIESESDYPYTGKDGDCQASDNKIVTKISGFVQIPKYDEQALQEAIATKGPVAVGVDASYFDAYESGIFNGPCNNVYLNHAILLVGYGSENGNEYYIAKNSWGKSWGTKGYMKLARNQDNMCGVGKMASYPEL
ncbi:hypothetical protein WA026_021928 [Henosepilachna vigintioctopunctata]|uniref:Cathepsin L n=1 Tax=Henosepilachna vigintioctopunctata TaxID=420089 RepID=A0AAW1VAL1_9CUCU